jgi:molecular chaperone DnaJ
VVQKPRKVTVTFPAGIDAGQRLRVSGQGSAGGPGAQPGDLYVEVDLEEDPRFERDGVDLITRMHIPFTDAAMGAEVRVASLSEADGSTVKLTIPAGTQSNAIFTLKGQGIPRLDGRGRGALIVVVQVDVPTKLSDRARTLLKELDEEIRPTSPHAQEAPRNRAASGG